MRVPSCRVTPTTPSSEQAAGEGASFLQKPFTPEELLRKMRQCSMRRNLTLSGLQVRTLIRNLHRADARSAEPLGARAANGGGCGRRHATWRHAIVRTRSADARRAKRGLVSIALHTNGAGSGCHGRRSGYRRDRSRARLLAVSAILTLGGLLRDGKLASCCSGATSAVSVDRGAPDGGVRSNSASRLQECVVG